MKSSLLISVAKTRLGAKYVLGAKANYDDPNFQGPFDCAEFVSWVVKQITGDLYGVRKGDAYTGFWADDANGKIVKKITVDEAVKTKGAILLRVPLNGIIGHIVFSQGDGKTVEAHSTKMGVIESVATGRRWDYGILIPGVEYEITKAQSELFVPANIYRVTSPYMRGEAVKIIQSSLIALGLKVGNAGADGVYGNQTALAIETFQKSEGLVPDGEAGPITLAKLGIKFLPV